MSHSPIAPDSSRRSSATALGSQTLTNPSRFRRREIVEREGDEPGAGRRRIAGRVRALRGIGEPLVIRDDLEVGDWSDDAFERGPRVGGAAVY